MGALLHSASFKIDSFKLYVIGEAWRKWILILVNCRDVHSTVKKFRGKVCVNGKQSPNFYVTFEFYIEREIYLHDKYIFFKYLI